MEPFYHMVGDYVKLFRKAIVIAIISYNNGSASVEEAVANPRIHINALLLNSLQLQA
jgi:hypothetical protein